MYDVLSRYSHYVFVVVLVINPFVWFAPAAVSEEGFNLHRFSTSKISNLSLYVLFVARLFLVFIAALLSSTS